MLTKAEEILNFQSLVIRNSQDFKILITLKNFLPYLESTVKAPFSCSSLIQGAWKLSEDKIYIPTGT